MDIARRFAIAPGEVGARELVAVEHTLEACRAVVRKGRPGLACLSRSDGDEPQIVETWI